MRWPRSASCSTRPKRPRRSNVFFRFGRLLRVHGESMAPRLTSGELVVVREGAYESRDPRRGELVAARPASLGGRAFVKRVAGVPGERVQLDGRAWTLAEDEFLLLGDRREDSLDSRRLGPVTRGELLGPVWLRLWPWTLFNQKAPGTSEVLARNVQGVM